MTMTEIDPTGGMTEEEFRAERDRKDGKGKLLHYGKYVGMNPGIVDVLDYTVDAEGQRVALVVTTTKIGENIMYHEYTVPLASMFAIKKIRGLGLKPAPWC